MNNGLEDLIIYKQYLDFVYYIENITLKYPKVEKYSLVKKIKGDTYDGMEMIIRAEKEYDKVKRLKILSDMDVKLKMLNVLARISYKRKYISSQNYYAWAKKLTNISNLLGGWIKTCVKQ